jgi:hypothetical protein
MVHHNLRYSRTKLWVIALLSILAVAFLLVLFTHPDYHVRGLFGGLVSGNFGHFVTLPILTLFLSAFAVRAAMLATGPGDAVVTDRRGLTANTWWRSHAIAWPDLAHIGLQTKTFRNSNHFTIKFHRRDGGAVSLPLAIVALPEGEYEAAVDALILLHRNAISSPAVSPRPVAANPAAQRSLTGQPRPTFGRRRV